MNTTWSNIETVTIEQVSAGDEISVQGGAEGSFFTVKSIRDGMASGIGIRSTEGEYVKLPFGYHVTRMTAV